MKIRIKGNSIRYRLTQTEIGEFEKNGWLEEHTEFLNNVSLQYRLERKMGIENIEAAYSGNTIAVYVPEKMANEWTGTDVVGFETKMKIVGGKDLFLLIEKDFVCLDPTLEDQSDNYPNPNKAC